MINLGLDLESNVSGYFLIQSEMATFPTSWDILVCHVKCNDESIRISFLWNGF